MRLEQVDQLNGNRYFVAPPSAWDRSPVRASPSRAPFAIKADVNPEWVHDFQFAQASQQEGRDPAVTS